MQSSWSWYHDSCDLSDGSVNQFVKLLSATPRQVLDLITNPEREALEGQLANLGKDEVSEEAFIVAALEDLKVSAVWYLRA